MRIARLLIALLFATNLHAQDSMSYTIKRAATLPEVTADWDDPAWQTAQTLEIATFHPRGSDHRPRTQARLLHNDTALSIIFRVEDRYVIAKHTQYQQPTHKDSCVEFFIQPDPKSGYFNFEMNAIGTLLLWFVEDPRRIEGKFQKYTPVPIEIAKTIETHTSLTTPIEEETDAPVTWTVSYRIPLSLFKTHSPDLETLSGQTWRGNFYKCADNSTHPHWGYWADIGKRLDFHQPKRFAPILFE